MVERDDHPACKFGLHTVQVKLIPESGLASVHSVFLDLHHSVYPFCFPNSRCEVPHVRICILNVSVVRINGNMSRVAIPRVRSYDAARFGAGARVFESCTKGCVAACFGVC